MNLLLIGMTEVLVSVGSGIVTASMLGFGALIWGMKSKLDVLTQMISDRDSDLDRRLASITKDIESLKADVKDLRKVN